MIRVEVLYFRVLDVLDDDDLLRARFVLDVDLGLRVLLFEE